MIVEVVASDSFKTLFYGKMQTPVLVPSLRSLRMAVSLGAFFGAGFSDRLGRRDTNLMACCIFVVGGVIQTAGVAVSMLYIGRLVAGIGVGFLTASASID